MKKFNKKGFTLVEMLVVIAIIAVLVSIVIPTVTSSTTKANYAADAANLRAAKAVVSINLLESKYTLPVTSLSASDLGIPDPGKTGAFAGSIDASGNISLTYGGKTIEQLADLAGGKAATCTKYEATSASDTTCKNCGKAQHA